VNHPARITYALDKLAAFEMDEGDWKNRVLHAGAILFFENQNGGDYPFIDGATCLDSIETAMMNDYQVTRLSEQAGVVRSSFPWSPLTETSFTSNWGTGEYALVNWSGHGWPTGPTGPSGRGTTATAFPSPPTASSRARGSSVCGLLGSMTITPPWCSPSPAMWDTRNPIPTGISVSIC
jgi:hypothetical protein